MKDVYKRQPGKCRYWYVGKGNFLFPVRQWAKCSFQMCIRDSYYMVRYSMLKTLAGKHRTNVSVTKKRHMVNGVLRIPYDTTKGRKCQLSDRQPVADLHPHGFAPHRVGVGHPFGQSFRISCLSVWATSAALLPLKSFSKKWSQNKVWNIWLRAIPPE